MHRSRPVNAILCWLTAVAASPGAVPPAGQAPEQPPPWQAAFSDPKVWQFPTLEDFQGWVEPYPGTQAPFATAVFQHANYMLGEGSIDVTLPKTEGLLRLKRPLVPGKALRLRLVDYPPTIIAWSGTAGAVIEADSDAALFGCRFHGSTATRTGDMPRPESRSLVADSAARVFGCGFFGARQIGRFQPLIDLAHHDGRLILSSGDITLVEAPLAEPPREILFDGSMFCGGIEMVPFVPPPRPAARLAATERWQPADLDWQVVGGGADGKADPARLERAADGSVRLEQPADRPAAAIAALWKIPPGPRGPREIIVHLDKCSPGAGLCIAGPDGKPRTVVGLVKPKGGGDAPGMLVDIWPATENRLEGGDIKRAGAAWVQGDAVWFRLRFGPRPCVVYAVSGDGEHWTDLGKQIDGQPPVAVGIVAPAIANAGVTLRGLAAADLPGLAALVPKDFVAAADKAVPDVAVADPAAWEERVRAAKPEPVAADHWAAIVATRSLAQQANNPTLDVPLLRILHRYALRDELPLETRIAICDDITRLWCDDGRNGVNILGVYALVGERLLAADDFAGLERLRRAAIDSPACVGGGAWFDPLQQQARWLERLAIAGPVDEYARVAMQASFGFTQRSNGVRDRLPQASWCLADIATRLDAAPLVKGGRPPQIKLHDGGTDAWVPPLAIATRSLGRDAANGASDLQQRLSERDWPGAQRAMQLIGDSLADDPDAGVLDQPGDRELSISPRLYVARTLADEPEFRDHMLAAEEPRAALRVRMLRDTADARGMAATAIAFAGTPSAAEACGWLGDREIAAGRFSSAREWYRWGRRFATPEQAGRLEAGARLATVLAGGAVAGPAALGPLAGAEAEALAKDLVAARGCAVPREPWRPADVPAAALPPHTGGFQPAARLDVAGGRLSGDAYMFKGWGGGVIDPRDARISHNLIDYAARTWTFTSAGPLLLACNRAEVLAIDPAKGTQVWRTGVDPEGRGVWSYTTEALPALDAAHVYLRRTMKAGRQLAALRLADGGVAWETPAPPGLLLTSSPVIADGELRVLGIRSGPFDTLLVLAGFDRATGRQIMERPLVALSPWWRGRYPRVHDEYSHADDGALALAGDRLVATLGGAVVSCDTAGRIEWVRQQPWLAPSADAPLNYVPARLPPLVDDGRLLVAQTGVPALTALDPADGRLLWRKAWPELIAVVGLTGAGRDRRLVVEAADGLHAVDPGDGTARLLLPRVPQGDWLGLGGIGHLYGATLLTAEGTAIVAVRRQAVEGGKPVWQPRLVWIDAASGSVRHEADVADLAGGAAFLGPLTAANGRFWALVQKEPPGQNYHGGLTARTLWEFVPQP
jgi:outer membrane protein assembly factor BamB